MANSINFPSTTTHFALPMLFAGQAQKEPFINQALTLIDSLLAGTVDDSLQSPPAEADLGSTYRVLDSSSGDWEGHDGDIAVWIGGAWEFVSPSPGLAVFDKAAGTRMLYKTNWITADEPTLPAGGATVDTEARGAISELVNALRAAGVFPDPS